MGLLDQNLCTNINCHKTTIVNGDFCPECGEKAAKYGVRDANKLIQSKKKYIKTPEGNKKKQIRDEKKDIEKTKQKEIKEAHKKQENEEKRLNRLLFSGRVSDDDLIASIELDMSNLAGHEAGTKWMRVGTLLSFNSTEQMIGAGFKAIIDQNKIKIKQNELILRELKKLNSE